MREGNAARKRRDDRSADHLDWDDIDAIIDEELKAVDIHPDAPRMTEEVLRAAALAMPSGEARVPISIRVEREVLDYFKGQGPGYQSRINAVLSAYVRTQRR